MATRLLAVGACVLVGITIAIVAVKITERSSAPTAPATVKPPRAAGCVDPRAVAPSFGYIGEWTEDLPWGERWAWLREQVNFCSD